MLLPLIAALAPLAAIDAAPSEPAVLAGGTAAERPSDPARAARLAAAGTLEQALERVATQDLAPAARLAVLRAAGDVAARTLAGQRVGELVADAVLDARWQATVDPEAAAGTLGEALDRYADDLRFRPVMEAEQPPGFPDPTPLHEIRLVSYPGYRLAYADMAGPRDGGAFFKLFQHIKRNEIAMTAPVEVTFDAGRMRQTRMAFLYEGPDQGEVGPDGSVEVVDVPPMQVVSIGCRGYDSNERIDALHALLTDWVAARDDLEPAGDLRTMGFNSPMVRGERRYFEVQLPVRPVEPAPRGRDVREL